MKQYAKSIIAIVLVSTLCLVAIPFSMSVGVSAQTISKISFSGVQGYSTIRGKIERKGDQKIYAASRVRVTLAPQEKPTSRITVYTGSDGMYYFHNVSMGTYILEVWSAEGKAIRKYSIKADRQYVDIAPIQID